MINQLCPALNVLGPYMHMGVRGEVLPPISEQAWHPLAKLEVLLPPTGLPCASMVKTLRGVAKRLSDRQFLRFCFLLAVFSSRCVWFSASIKWSPIQLLPNLYSA